MSLWKLPKLMSVARRPVERVPQLGMAVAMSLALLPAIALATAVAMVVAMLEAMLMAMPVASAPALFWQSQSQPQNPPGLGPSEWVDVDRLPSLDTGGNLSERGATSGVSPSEGQSEPQAATLRVVSR